MPLRILKNPGCSPSLLVLASAARTKALLLAMTPSASRTGAREVAVAPAGTCTVTVPWPWPVKFAGWYLAW